MIKQVKTYAAGAAAAALLAGGALFAPDAAAQQSARMRLQTAVPAAADEFKMLQKFSQRVDAMSGGRLKIEAPGLGMSHAEADALHARLTGCNHLAAVYDLAVKREVGERINVEGTKNVLEFLGDARRLDRLHYVSTAYVSGTAVGVYRESDLDVGQSFKNFYEETKFLAEVEVVQSGLPCTTYRPGIVVGDSKTGETAKFDGPYFSLRAMSRLPSPGIFMKVGWATARSTWWPWTSWSRPWRDSPPSPRAPARPTT